MNSSSLQAIKIQHFFDPLTSTLSYIVYDESSRDGVIIDPVMDFDSASGQVWDESASKLLSFVDSHKLKIHFVLETHAHADHLSGAQILKKKISNLQVAIGSGIKEVQSTFKKIFGMSELHSDGSQFDRLLKNEETITAGTLKIQILFTPGHTPACVTYRIGDALFTGDLLFMPDSGTGRCDFPAGDARKLYNSVMNIIYSYPDSTKIFVGHDYQPGGRNLMYESTVVEQKAKNIHIKANTAESDFVSFRTSRDKTLSAPKLLLPSIQVNIDAGRLPLPQADSVRFLKIPLTIKMQ